MRQDERPDTQGFGATMSPAPFLTGSFSGALALARDERERLMERLIDVEQRIAAVERLLER